MRYVVTYRRIPQELPNGRRTSDGFYLIDRSWPPNEACRATSPGSLADCAQVAPGV